MSSRGFQGFNRYLPTLPAPLPLYQLLHCLWYSFGLLDKCRPSSRVHCWQCSEFVHGPMSVHLDHGWISRKCPSKGALGRSGVVHGPPGQSSWTELDRMHHNRMHEMEYLEEGESFEGSWLGIYTTFQRFLVSFIPQIHSKLNS